MRGNVLIIAQNGLCNRLFAVMNGLYLREVLALDDLFLQWRLGPGCRAEWKDLFVGPEIARVAERFPGRNNRIRVVAKGPREYESISRTRLIELAGRFVPTPEIQGAVNSFAADHGIDRTVVGVHVRKTDRLATPEADRAMDEDVAQQIEAVRKKEPGRRFFLCSDDQETERRFAARFPDEIVVRTRKAYIESPVAGRPLDRKLARQHGLDRKAEIVQDALVDLYLLSLTDFRIANLAGGRGLMRGWGRRFVHGGFSSTFALFARYLSQADLTRAGIHR